LYNSKKWTGWDLNPRPQQLCEDICPLSKKQSYGKKSFIQREKARTKKSCGRSIRTVLDKNRK
jgi:hypothetical protein